MLKSNLNAGFLTVNRGSRDVICYAVEQRRF